MQEWNKTIGAQLFCSSEQSFFSSPSSTHFLHLILFAYKWLMLGFMGF